MNLIQDAWIPVRRKSGKVEPISPSQICESDIISLAAPRPDFNGALIQFLIGLLQTTCAPKNPQIWRRWLREPPSQKTLQTAFEPIIHAFELDGVGARFMQDFTLEKEIKELKPKEQDKKTNTIYELLIDQPTGKTLSDNTDHFIKGKTIDQICLPCAAMALMTLQMNAPSGGSGHRTSLRGGGPMTTLILSNTFWETCWFNILEKDTFLSHCGNQDKKSDSDRFPWLCKTRTSEGNRITTPEDTHPDQIFWSMPRRIHFMFSNWENGDICHLCGKISKRGVSTYFNKNLGINYEGSWRHPFTPYFIAEDDSPASVKPQQGGIGYRHWLGLVQSNPAKNGKKQPAKVLEQYLKRKDVKDLRLWAFGYDMDNMKARCWHDSTMPLVLADEGIREDYVIHVSALVNAAQQIARDAKACLKKALFKPKQKLKAGALSFVEARFWQSTEVDFFHFLHRLRESLTQSEEVLPILDDWHNRLIKEAETIFNDLSQTGSFEAADPKRIALAWRDLQKIRGKKVRSILGLPEKQVAKS